MNRSSWTLGTVVDTTDVTCTRTLAARKHIGDNVVQVATNGVPVSPVWRSATSWETASFAPLPVAAMPV